MSDIAIRVENLGKLYRIGKPERYRTLRDSLADTAKAPFRIWRNAASDAVGADDSIWALKNVSFEVKRGEVIGVIGRNGAGKSTLLKVLSRITEPTEGHVEIHGRVGSLLEVGTGFHPELTGRENIFLNGAILGMKRAEINSKFDEIVAFAEIDKFLDTPVKHYSSGMYVRLAFAVAAHLEPEILIVDEVLAVGDAAFQDKCLGKMSDVVREGRTILFVSHSMASVASLCSSAILLGHGSAVMLGPTNQVIAHYSSSLHSAATSADLRNFAKRRGSGEVRISHASIFGARGLATSNFEYADDITVEFTLNRFSRCADFMCVVLVRTATGIPVLHLANHDDQSWVSLPPDNELTVSCVIKNCQLYPGTYFVSLWIGTNSQDIDVVIDALAFRMEQGRLSRLGFDLSWTQGIFHNEAQWHIFSPVVTV